jgi:hypothetical protein
VDLKGDPLLLLLLLLLFLQDVIMRSLSGSAGNEVSLVAD